MCQDYIDVDACCCELILSDICLHSGNLTATTMLNMKVQSYAPSR